MLPQLPRSGHLSNGIFSLRPISSTAQSFVPFQDARGSSASRQTRGSQQKGISARCGVHHVIQQFGCREFTLPKGLIWPDIFAQAVCKTASASYP
jgi:hypothetical protein